MTRAMAERLDSMKAQGLGYKMISKESGIGLNTVKSYFRRKGAGDSLSKRCLCCGKPVEQTAGRREKKFCSDACRMKWWNSHRNQVNRRAFHTFICACCGHEFTAYANAGRKYCSRECYIKGRFEMEETHDEKADAE